MQENTHQGQSTTAVFVTAEQKAAGLDPAAVAAAAAQAGKSAAVSQPGQRGISVQHIAGPQVQQGIPRGVSQPAQVFASAPTAGHDDARVAVVAGPNAPTEGAALMLAGQPALDAARKLGRRVNTPVGQLPPDSAMVFLPAAAASIMLPLSAEDALLLATLPAPALAADASTGIGTPPAPELAQTPLPAEAGTGGASGDSTGDGHHDMAAQRAYARAPGAQLVVEFRGPVRLVTTGRVHVTHATDEENGLDVVELTPHDEASPVIVEETPSDEPA